MSDAVSIARPVDDDESDDEAYIRPAAKKTKTTQAAVTDFFGKGGPQEVTKKATARKPSGSKPAAAKKPASKKVESDVDEDEIVMSDVAETRPAAPTRAARGHAKKYIEIESDPDSDDMYGE